MDIWEGWVTPLIAQVAQSVRRAAFRCPPPEPFLCRECGRTCAVYSSATRRLHEPYGDGKPGVLLSRSYTETVDIRCDPCGRKARQSARGAERAMRNGRPLEV